MNGLAPRSRASSRSSREDVLHVPIPPRLPGRLILFRNILTRVQGAYYFRPSVDYDFIRDTNGQQLGGGAAVIWSRASEFIQTPGHERDLGIELDLQSTTSRRTAR